MTTTNHDIYMQPARKKEADDAFAAMKKLRDDFMANLKEVERQYDDAMVYGNSKESADWLHDLHCAAENYFEAGIVKLWPFVSDEARYA